MYLICNVTVVVGINVPFVYSLWALQKGIMNWMRGEGVVRGSRISLYSFKPTKTCNIFHFSVFRVRFVHVSYDRITCSMEF